MKILIILAILLLASSCHGECLETILVFSGDTCDTINDNNPNGISMDEFMALNPGIDCNNLEPGSQVCLAGDLPESDNNNNNNDQEPSSDGNAQNSSDQELDNPPQESDQEQTSNGSVQDSGDQQQSDLSEESDDELTSIGLGTSSDLEQSNISDESEEEQEDSNDNGQTDSVTETSPTEAVIVTSDEEQSPSEAVGTSSDEQSSIEEESTPIPSDAEEYEPFIQEVIAAHQFYRNFFGSPPLVWNYTLNASALSWVEYCMSINSFPHSVERGAGSKYGENIGLLAGYYYDSTGRHSVKFNATQIIDALIGSEWNNFINGSVIFDNSASVTGNWYNIGHFTQAIWKNTTSVGCGITSSGDTTALVCQYYPPGNAFGEKIY